MFEIKKSVFKTSHLLLRFQKIERSATIKEHSDAFSWILTGSVL